jgi:hypothetical protein
VGNETESLTDRELAEEIKRAFAKVSHAERRALGFREVSHNDLHRVLKRGLPLSEGKRQQWMDIIDVWRDHGCPEPQDLAVLMGRKTAPELEFLIRYVGHPAWNTEGVDLTLRTRVAREIGRLEGFGPSRLQELDRLLDALTIGGENAKDRGR